MGEYAVRPAKLRFTKTACRFGAKGSLEARLSDQVSKNVIANCYQSTIKDRLHRYWSMPFEWRIDDRVTSRFKLVYLQAKDVASRHPARPRR
jgi:hypothetical protein